MKSFKDHIKKEAKIRQWIEDLAPRQVYDALQDLRKTFDQRLYVGLGDEYNRQILCDSKSTVDFLQAKVKIYAKTGGMSSFLTESWMFGKEGLDYLTYDAAFHSTDYCGDFYINFKRLIEHKQHITAAEVKSETDLQGLARLMNKGVKIF